MRFGVNNAVNQPLVQQLGGYPGSHSTGGAPFSVARLFDVPGIIGEVVPDAAIKRQPGRQGFPCQHIFVQLRMQRRAQGFDTRISQLLGAQGIQVRHIFSIAIDVHRGTQFVGAGTTTNAIALIHYGF